MNIKKAFTLVAEYTRKYFRVDVEGLEHIPQEGGVLIVPNHSGYVAADAVMIAHMIERELGRTPRILAHRAFFDLFGFLNRFAKGIGLEKISVRHGIELLKQGEIVLIFPEGIDGNFKPSIEKYNLQRFHTGFARMALEADVPIVPCLVIGAEESHLNLGSIDLSKYMKGLRMPLPLNLIPLPAKWKIKFLEPVSLVAQLPAPIDKISSNLKEEMQNQLNEEVRKRPYIYFAPPKE